MRIAALIFHRVGHNKCDTGNKRRMLNLAKLRSLVRSCLWKTSSFAVSMPLPAGLLLSSSAEMLVAGQEQNSGQKQHILHLNWPGGRSPA
jgi:hypothetical protein